MLNVYIILVLYSINVLNYCDAVIEDVCDDKRRERERMAETTCVVGSGWESFGGHFVRF